MKKKNSFIMKNENFFLEQKNFDGLLPILWTGLGRWACRRWAGAGQALAREECAGRARSAQAGVRGRAGEGAGVGAGRWQERTGRAGGSSARAWSSGGHASGRRRGGARARAGSGTAGRAGARAAGRQARARQGSRSGRAGRWAWARSLGAA